MRLLFFHDHRFRWSRDGRVWTTGAFSAQVWQRYLQHFDSVNVIGRDGGQYESLEGFARSDAKGVTFDFLRDISGLRGTLRRRSVSREIAQLVSGADAVIVRLASEFGLAACAAAEKQRKPYLIEVVGSAFDAYYNYGSALGKLYAPIAEHRVRRAVAKAPLVVYVTGSWLQTRYPTENPEISLLSHSVGDLLGRWSASAVTNALVVLPDASTRQKRKARLKEVIEGRPIILGTIASLTSRSKGIQVALAALTRLREQGFTFTYRILGGGNPLPWQAMIDEHGLSECCVLDGTLPAGPAVLEWLDHIDLYLQPSLQEGLPRSVLEAMSRGAPCLGSSAGGTPELIDPQFIHPAGDSEELVSHLQLLLREPKELCRLSELSLAGIATYAPETIEAKRQAMFAALAAQAYQSKKGERRT